MKEKLQLLCVIVSFFIFGTIGLQAEDDNPDKSWPREIDVSNAVITIYQPQLDSFKGNKIKVRAAVSVLKKGESKPEYCAIWIDAKVNTDKDTRMATFDNIKITKFAYPDTSDKMKKSIETIIVKNLVQADFHISLDRLSSMMYALEEYKKEEAKLEQNTVPKFYFSTKPSVLVLIDGKPVMRSQEGGFELVANTEYFIAQDTKTKKYYLKCVGKWFTADELSGKWTVTKEIPEAIKTAGNASTPQKDKIANDTIPEIFVSTEPAELIQSFGPPELGTILGTNLSYLKNSDNDIFRDEDNGKLYLLVSGRWFTADKKEGPWSYINSKDLPEAFRKISERSPKASVLASIAGTQEAKDAVLESYIPQTATLKRKETKLDINYDGDPLFKPVTKTTLEYAVNTSNTVIKYQDKYYACVNGAWYVSDNPNGPWMVCVNVPDEIYKIPPSNPNYNSTYVHVYDYDDNYVNVGYTSGYLGSFVIGGCIAFGTGFAYACYVGNKWCPRPVTYGCHFRYNHISGNWHCYDRYRINNGKYVAWNNRRTAFRSHLPGRAYGTYINKNNFVKVNNAYVRNNLAVKEALIRNGKLGAAKRLGRVNRKLPNNVYVNKDGKIYRHTLNGWETRNKGKWESTAARRKNTGDGLRRDLLNKRRLNDSAERRRIEDSLKRRGLSEERKREILNKRRLNDNADRRRREDAIKRRELSEKRKREILNKRRLNDSAERRRIEDRIRAEKARRPTPARRSPKRVYPTNLNRSYKARKRGSYKASRARRYRATHSRRSSGRRSYSGGRRSSGGGRSFRGGGRR